MQKCPKCGLDSSELIPIDAGVRLSLAGVGIAELPNAVCGPCFAELKSKSSAGAALIAERKAQEHNKNMLWKSRVNLIKQGRQLMESRAYAKAAVSYEKYIKVLEVVYGVKNEDINPDLFSKSNRSKEMNVIASVYWDLFRIYDNSPNLSEKLRQSANKLVLFLPYTSIYGELTKAMEDFVKSAKNPQVARDLLRQVKRSKVRCFIASSAFESPNDPCVVTLQHFRRDVLSRYSLGRGGIYFYYLFSPGFAKVLDEYPRFKPFLRLVLLTIAKLIRVSRSSSLSSRF